MNRRNGFRCTVFLAAFGATAVAQAGLLVTDVRGKAEIEGKGPLQLLAEVADGATLSVQGDAVLVAVDLANGREYSIRSAGRYLVERGNVKSLGGGRVDSSNLPAKQMPDIKIASARVAQATLVMRSVRKTGPQTVSPVNTTVLDATPVLRWVETPGATGYRVELRDAAGTRLVDSRVTGSSLQLTGAAGLKPGGRYVWRATALGEQNLPGEQGGEFSVLGTSEAARIEPFRPQPGAEFSRMALYAALLTEVGATEEARLVWQALRAERPQDAALGKLAE